MAIESDARFAKLCKAKKEMKDEAKRGISAVGEMKKPDQDMIVMKSAGSPTRINMVTGSLWTSIPMIVDGPTCLFVAEGSPLLLIEFVPTAV